MPEESSRSNAVGAKKVNLGNLRDWAAAKGGVRAAAVGAHDVHLCNLITSAATKGRRRAAAVSAVVIDHNRVRALAAAELH